MTQNRTGSKGILSSAMRENFAEGDADDLNFDENMLTSPMADDGELVTAAVIFASGLIPYP